MNALRPPRTRNRELDEACAAAADLARSAAADVAGPAQVGEYLEARADGDRIVTHLFASADPAYRGWHWAVTVARAARAKAVTVSEVVLLPGPEALLAPDWVPWRDRVLPGDVGVGDLLPAQPDDDRLVPAAVLQGDDGILEWDDDEPWRSWAAWDSWVTSEAPLAEDEDAPDDAEGESPEAGSPAAEGPVFGGSAVAGGSAVISGSAAAARDAQDDAATGRSRVLSSVGRDEAATRWYSGEHGPASPLAHAAPGPCMTCGFLTRMGGPLGHVFGVCANEYAPDDGRVVSLDHGCGAHSEASIPEGAREAASPVIDEMGYDLACLPGTPVSETVFEFLDHS